MTAREPASYLEFLADGHSTQCAGDTQTHDTARLTSLYRLKTGYHAEINARAFAHYIRQLVGSICHGPAVEIGSSVKIAAVEHTSQNIGIRRGAKRLRSRHNPPYGLFFITQIRHGMRRHGIACRLKT